MKWTWMSVPALPVTTAVLVLIYPGRFAAPVPLATRASLAPDQVSVNILAKAVLIV